MQRRRIKELAPLGNVFHYVSPLFGSLLTCVFNPIKHRCNKKGKIVSFLKKNSDKVLDHMTKFFR